MKEVRPVEGIEVEIFRDGEWQEIYDVGAVTINRDILHEPRLWLGISEQGIEVHPPWRVFVEGELAFDRDDE